LIIYCFTSCSRIFHWNGDVIFTGEGLHDWLIDVPLKNFSLVWRRHHGQWRAAKFRPVLNAQGLWAERDLYRDTGTRFFRSHPKDHPIQSPLTTPMVMQGPNLTWILTGWLQNKGLSMLGAQGLREGRVGFFFIVQHLLWHGASVFPVSSEGLPHSVTSYYTHENAEDIFLPGSPRVQYALFSLTIIFEIWKMVNKWKMNKLTIITIVMYFRENTKNILLSKSMERNLSNWALVLKNDIESLSERKQLY
jgi:hypothetical protein